MTWRARPATASRRPRVAAAGPRSLRRRLERVRRRRVRLRRRTAVLVAASTAVGLGAGAAVGYWVSTGTGTITASLPGLEITARAGDVTGLYPGGAERALGVVLRNHGPVPVEVTEILPRAESDRTGCPPSALVVRSRDRLPVLAPEGTASATLAVTMAPDAPDACQGAAFRILLTVRGRA